MENTKNFFENWAETQKTMLDNWAEKTREFQNSIMDGQVFTKGADMYQDWMKKQQENFKGFTKSAERAAENTEHTAENLFDKFFEQWKSIQEKTVEAWSDAANKMHSFFNAQHVNGAQDFANSFLDNARKYQESWMNALTNMAGGMKWPTDMADFASKTTAEAYSSMQKGADNFKKLFELWTPVFKAAQSNIFNTDEYKKLMNPVLYKELMDKMFGFDALNPLKQAYNQYVKTVSGWYENLSDKAKENFDAFRKQMDTMAANLPQSQDYFMDAFRTYAEQLKSSVSPFFKLMPDGKEKEQITLMNQLGEYYIDAANKMAKLQYLVYVRGAKVNEQIMAELADKAKNNQMYENFSDFYNNWVNVNGKAFEDMFRTDEFSKLQGELVTLDSQIRMATDKLMEMALAPYPVVLKSQLDEIYKANYELKKQVYEMGKQLASMVKTNAQPAAEAKTEEPAAAAAPKTSTRKK